MELKVKVTAGIMDMVENFRKERLYELDQDIEFADGSQMKTALRSVHRKVKNADQAEIVHMYLMYQATKVRF